LGENRKSRRKSEKRSKPKKWLIVLSTIFVIATVLFGSYYLISNKADSTHISFLKSIKVNVDKSNEDNAKLLAEVDKFDYKNSKEINSLITSIQKNIEPIDKSINELAKYNSIPKYMEQFNAFRAGIEANKKIYTQAILILRSQGNKGIVDALSSLDAIITETTKNYDKAKLSKVHIVLPNEILNLGGDVRTFAMNAYNDFEAKSMLLEQYTAYFNAMEKVNSDFQKSKVDFSVYVNAMETGNKTLSDIYIDIDKKLIEISSIKSSYDAISVPSKLAAKHKKFDTIIKDYFLYSNNYKAFLTELEEAGENKDALNALVGDFEKLNTKYGDISKSFTEYTSNFNTDKYFYQDLNNL
jgi:hypothetical protein